MSYEYRIIKYEEGDEVFYCIEECLLDEDGVMGSHTIEYSPKCKSVEELKKMFLMVSFGLIGLVEFL